MSGDATDINFHHCVKHRNHTLQISESVTQQMHASVWTAINFRVFDLPIWCHYVILKYDRKFVVTLVWTQVMSCRICGVQSCTEADILWTLQFPLPILTLPTALHSLIILSSYTVLILPASLNKQLKRKRKKTEDTPIGMAFKLTLKTWIGMSSMQGSYFSQTEYLTHSPTPNMEIVRSSKTSVNL